MKRALLLAAPLLFLGSGSARAEVITWEALMTITAAHGDTSPGTPLPPDMFPVGSSLTWTITFDTARAESDPAVVGPLFGGPGMYHYPVGDMLAWSASTTDWSIVGGRNSVLRVQPNSMTLDTSLTGDIHSNLPGAWQFRGFDVFLNWNTALPSLALPSDRPDSGRFQAFLEDRRPGGGSGTVQGTLVSVYAVPEPSTLLLTGLAMLGGATVRAARRRSAGR